MANEVLEIREGEINNIVSYLNTSSNNVSGSLSGLSSFSSFTNVGLFSSGMDKIGKQLTSISESISEASSSVSTCYDKFYEVEEHLSSLADQITIPRDFVKDDNSYLVEINGGELNKEDGRAVNSDNENHEQNFEFLSSVKFNEKMEKIVKDYEELHGEIAINGTLTKLENIKKDVSEKINYVLDESNIVKKALTELKSEESDTLPDIDYSIDLAKINLEHLDSNDLSEASYEDRYNIKNSKLTSKESHKKRTRK